MYVCMHICMHQFMHKCTKSTYIYIYIHTHIHTYIHTYMYIHIYRERNLPGYACFEILDCCLFVKSSTMHIHVFLSFLKYTTKNARRTHTYTHAYTKYIKKITHTHINIRSYTYLLTRASSKNRETLACSRANSKRSAETSSPSSGIPDACGSRLRT
jgi:hypothetical protein